MYKLINLRIQQMTKKLCSSCLSKIEKSVEKRIIKKENKKVKNKVKTYYYSKLQAFFLNLKKRTCGKLLLKFNSLA